MENRDPSGINSRRLARRDSYEDAFGALLAFMAVNVSALRQFWFSPEAAGHRNFFVDAFVPGFGFVFCFMLLISLQPWTKYAGLVWLGVGFAYLVYKTRGFKLRPKLFDFSAS